MAGCHENHRYSPALDFSIRQLITRRRGTRLSNGVHDDLADQPRRQRYRSCVAAGELPAGYATEDGVALHFVGSALAEAVSAWHEGRAWHVAPDGAGGYTETPITPRQWNPPWAVRPMRPGWARRR
jgi:hypothetical protein